MKKNSEDISELDKAEGSLKDILDTSRNYEQLAFHKGVAGIYYRIALGMLVGLFGLIILEGISEGQIFYDKGFFGQGTEFTLTQVGIIIVFILIIGDLSFTFTRFVTDQKYTEYLSVKHRSRIVKNFSMGSVIGGVLIAIPTIFLASYDLIGEAQGWGMMGLFISTLFTLLGYSTKHRPTLFYGLALILASIFIGIEVIPGPYWLIFMMVLGATAFVTAIWSYFVAQHLD